MRRSTKGFLAGLAGAAIETCPHAQASRDAAEWRAAWTRGAAERARRERSAQQGAAYFDDVLAGALARGERPAWGLQ